MRTVVVTNCTNRKRLDGRSPVSLQKRVYSSLNEMALAWSAQIDLSTSEVPASSLYLGRSVTEAKYVAAKLDAKLMFASTGLGLVDSDQKCPPYNLTVAQDANSIGPLLEGLGADASNWWDALSATKSKITPIAKLANSHEVDLILLALPSSYMRLIANDIGAIQVKDQRKLRIFTSKPGLGMLPDALKNFAMPYDERLETSTLPGTRGDFPQRALRHFVEILELWAAPVDEARAAVSEAMNELSVSRTIERRRVSDDEITFMLECAWAKHEGSSTRLLRYLRDDALVSCEQSRFRRLWQEIKRQDNAETLA